MAPPPRRTLLTCLLALAVLITTACSSSSPDRSEGASGSARTKQASKSTDDDEEEGGGGGKQCEPHDAAAAAARPSASATRLSDTPVVDAVPYPLPDYGAKVWSQWGQGAVAAGRFFSAVGDGCGADGNSYLYEYDPGDRQLQLRADVLSVTDHRPGAWGFGKIHAQLVPGPDGMLYTSTYWGTHKGLTYGNGYDGDVLLRIDPATGAVTSLGTPIPKHGVPSLTGWTKGGLLYGEAVNPEVQPKRGPFFVYDIRARKVVFQADPDNHVGFRNMMVDGEGRAWFSAGDGRLQVWDPSTRKLEESDVRLPGDWVRASTRPAADGTVYGVTKQPATFFALHPDGKVQVLGAAKGYTTSMALTPDGKYFYYVPDAHGKAWTQGTPLIKVDTRTGEQETVVALNELAERRLSLRLGGSYDIALDNAGSRAFIGFNANAPSAKNAFGKPVLVVVDLP